MKISRDVVVVVFGSGSWLLVVAVAAVVVMEVRSFSGK